MGKKECEDIMVEEECEDIMVEEECDDGVLREGEGCSRMDTNFLCPTLEEMTLDVSPPPGVCMMEPIHPIACSTPRKMSFVNIPNHNISSQNISSQNISNQNISSQNISSQNISS